MKAPTWKMVEYKKYGFCKTRFQAFYCPECENQLNAGPEYQPKRCDNCGIKLDFSGIEYKPEEFLGYAH